MKIGIVGDPHIEEQCRERTDNYLSTAIRKLDYIAKDGNDKVILLGDVFCRPENSDYLFNVVYKFFARHKGKFCTLVGNHDIINHDYSTLRKTTLGNLAETGVLEIMTKNFTLGGLDFVVSLCRREMSVIEKDTTNKKILLGHNYVELDDRESFTKDELRELNYNLVILGHDHKPYEDEILNNTILIRPGSLTRRDTQSYNENRIIKYIQLDTETGDYEYRVVPTHPSVEVYKENSFKKAGKVDYTPINYSQLTRLLEQFVRNGRGNVSLDSVLKRIGTKQKYINYIKDTHDLHGVPYN